MTDNVCQFEALLQRKLTEGWQTFLQTDQYQHLVEFAEFLDGLPEFQSVHRKRIPHPAHEFTARAIGLPLMNTLVDFGILMNHWFPGNYYDSFEDEADGPISIRTFSLTLIANGSELCRLAIDFPHLHDGFGFKEPSVRIVAACRDAESRLESLLQDASQPT